MPEFVRRIPSGDTIERAVCVQCGHVDYENPKIVVGAVVAQAGRVLLCRRAIPPRAGFWTLPAGYLELGETLEEGAAREADEEAQATISIEGVLGLFTISRVGQVQVIFRARFADPDAVPLFGAGPESREVRLFGWEEIPWADIAFPSVRWALDTWRALGDGRLGAPARNPAEDPRGTHILAPDTEGTRE
jgi:ADP-ribose pyrophosphatase YjhB (NUDIX family)